MKHIDTVLRLGLVAAIIGMLFAIGSGIGQGDPARAGHLVNATSVNATSVNATSGVAIHGFDPVAYFLDREPVKGSERFKTVWRGAEWWFASRDNQALFEAAPWRYAPQFGGFSVYGASRGKSYDADPRLFDIIDGQLYLSRNERVRGLWQENPEGYIASARKRWQPAALRM